MGIFNFINKHAVTTYQDELSNLIDLYSSLNKEKLADYFVYSVWTRAGFQNEGHFKLPNGKHNLSPGVDYSMLAPIQNAISILKKQGNITEATALSIWLHSSRGVANAEMENSLKELWGLIMDTKKFWNAHLEELCEEDLKSGMDKNLLDATLALSKDILTNVPPKQFR